MKRTRRAIAARVLACLSAAAVIIMAGFGTQVSGAAGRAHIAKTEYLNENANLTLEREQGTTLIEHGHASGTYNASVAAEFTMHPKRIVALVTVYPHGGSITGSADADYVVQDSTGYFGGSFTIDHGTGSFSHVRGKAVSISGTINRNSFSITVKAHGWITH